VAVYVMEIDLQTGELDRRKERFRLRKVADLGDLPAQNGQQVEVLSGPAHLVKRGQAGHTGKVTYLERLVSNPCPRHDNGVVTECLT
jgi:hypothetical protein